MTWIDSLDDPRVADYRLLTQPDALRHRGLFVVEGRLILRRIVALPRFRLRSVLLTATAHNALNDTLDRLDHAIPVFVADQPVMNGLAGFAIHRGCLALAERPTDLTLLDLDLDHAQRLLVLEGVNNPDNVGGIFRSAAAFAVDSVILGPGCGDPLYRKAIRTSMAGALQVPFASASPWPDALRTLAARGFYIVGLTPAPDATSLDDVPRNLGRVALLVGAEGHGLSPEALGAAARRVRIPMPGSADSLNVTVAASIALYHLIRTTEN